MSPVNRRSFLGAAAAGLGAAAVGRSALASGPLNIALPNLGLVPVEPRSPINHVVVVMMENRSVDHYLGWYARENKHFDGTQARTYTRTDGAAYGTTNWGTAGRGDFAGCGFLDPGHGHGSGRVQARDHDHGPGARPGEPDGFLKDGAGNDEFALSYYEAGDIPVTAALTRQFTTFDRYFCSVLASTYPNREYMHSAQSGGITNNDFPPQRAQENPEWLTGFDWPTIWDALDAKGVTWAYYYSNLPVIALWGGRYAAGARHISTYYADCAAGTLPQVCFVDPFFVAPEGFANDDHPLADLRLGQMFLSDITRAFVESRHFARGAMFITYDEWGGFWDHVMPPTVPDPRSAVDDGDFGRLGFRVPTQVVSPYTTGGRVDHGVYDHTSILKFIEINWQLLPMRQWDVGTRDPGSRHVGHAFADYRFDPDARDRYLDTPAYEAPGSANTPCSANAPMSELFVLLENGWMETHGFRTDFPFADAYRSTLPVLR